MTDSPKNGEVILRFEPPDLILATYIGDIDGPHILASEIESVPYLESAPLHFLLLDVSRLTSFSPEARRLAGHSGGKTKSQLRGIAIVGASFHYRVMGTLVSKAANLLYHRQDNPVSFFTNETEARDWIMKRRREVAAK